MLMRPIERRSAAVVGAGPGGLAAAMLLAAQGADVTVFEKDAAVGGRTQDAGGGRLPLRHRADVLSLPADPAGQSSRAAASTSPTTWNCAASIRATGWRSRTAPRCASPATWPALEQRDRQARRARREVDPPLHRAQPRQAGRVHAGAETPVQQPVRLSRAQRVEGAAAICCRSGSVDDELKRYFRDPRVRLAFSFQTKYLGMSPFRCPNLFTFLAYLEYEFGVWHPVGGCGAVSEGMAQAARRSRRRRSGWASPWSASSSRAAGRSASRPPAA